MRAVLMGLWILAQEGPDPLLEGRSRLAGGDLLGAEAVLREGLLRTEAELRAPLHAALAEAQWRGGQSAEALLSLEAALRLEPSLAAAHHVAAQVQLARGGYAAARAHAAQDLAEDPGCAACWGVEQESLLALGRADEASERWEALARRSPPPEVRLARARGLHRLGALTPARQEVERALAAGLADPEAMRLLQAIREEQRWRWAGAGLALAGGLLGAGAVWAARRGARRRVGAS